MTTTNTVTVEKRRSSGRWFVGGALVVLGLLLLLDTTELLPVDGFDVFLAAALLVWGLYGLVSSGFRRVFWPGAFVLVGLGWLAVEFELLTGAQAGQFWPVLVVLLGLSLVFGRRRRTVVHRVENGETYTSADDESAVAVFGDATMDLRGRDDSLPMSVDAVAILGEVTVVVPEHWVVAVNAASVLGDVKDRRRSHPEGTPDLVVDGVAVLGDIVVRD